MYKTALSMPNQPLIFSKLLSKNLTIPDNNQPDITIINIHTGAGNSNKIINENTFDKDNINFLDTSQFENLSWTISVNSMDNGIKSFHSYLPSFMYSSTTKWFSHYQIPFISRTIFEHNRGNVLTPFIVETVDKFVSIQPFSSSVVNYISDSYSYDSVYKDYVLDHNDTFNKAIFYNTHQSSGLLNLEVKNTPFATPSSSDSILVNKKEQVWKLNGFRNNVIDETIPLFSKRWSDISSSYFIDKVPNPQAIDYDKGLFNKDRLRDNYLITRLIYEGNNKLTYKFNIDKSKITIR
jgi:hypothetical protein